MDVSKEILNFLTDIHGNEKQPENRKEKMFDKAFELAYKDMSTHTVTYKKEAKEKYFYKDNKICNDNRKAVKDCIKSFVKDKIFGGVDLKELKDNLREDSFDSWHEKACTTFHEFKEDKKIQLNEGKEAECLNALIDHQDHPDNIFTIGQSQKLINMMIKYLYIYNKCEEENERVLKSNDLSNIEKHAHAAIDDYVLKAVYGKNYKETKWSKLDKYTDENGKDSYTAYKDKVKEKAGKETLFLWELKNWPFEEE